MPGDAAICPVFGPDLPSLAPDPPSREKGPEGQIASVDGGFSALLPSLPRNPGSGDNTYGEQI